MTRFDKYFLMKETDVADYVQEKLAYFQKDTELECKEIGDGNINYIFRIIDKKLNQSVIVKQAGEVARISADMKLSTDRGRIEAKILKMENEYAPGLVPKVYFYDEVMCAIIMEDMINHTMMRIGLMNHEIYPLFSEHISTFFVNSLLFTSDIVMNHKEKKKKVINFINPDLCDISEELVFSEPYIDYNHRNYVFPLNKEFIQKEIYEDEQLRLEAAKLKFEFMNKTQALIHGDLHTGSIFINRNHTFIFDPEFAFFGPIGYDIGNIIANMFFSWCHGEATIKDCTEKEKFCGWIITCMQEIIDKFIVKFKATYKNEVTDIMAKTEGFMDYYLSQVLADTAGVAGLESIRRIVGMAKVKDITSISDEEKRARAERIIITLAKDYIKNRQSFQSGADYKKAVEKAVKQFT